MKMKKHERKTKREPLRNVEKIKKGRDEEPTEKACDREERRRERTERKVKEE